MRRQRAPATLTRLPRNRAEGDIPLMAMVTGNVDALECVLRKIGIDDSEFTTPAGGGRVQLYVADGANAGRNTPAASDLYNTPATLSRYDMVLFACEGAHIEKPPAAQRNLVDYANARRARLRHALQLHVALQRRALLQRRDVDASARRTRATPSPGSSTRRFREVRPSRSG